MSTAPCRWPWLCMWCLGGPCLRRQVAAGSTTAPEAPPPQSPPFSPLAPRDWLEMAAIVAAAALMLAAIYSG